MGKFRRGSGRIIVSLGAPFRTALLQRVQRIVDSAAAYMSRQLSLIQKCTGRMVNVRVELSGGGARDSLVRTALDGIQNKITATSVSVQRGFTSGEAVCLGGLEICKNSEWLEESVTRLQGDVRCRGADILFKAD